MEPARRKRNRLSAYNYSLDGGYFVTVCTAGRAQILSNIIVGDGSPVPHLTETGRLVEEHIKSISDRYLGVTVDKYVIMPNHLHMILIFDRGTNGKGNPSSSNSGEISRKLLGQILGWFKYQTTKAVNLRKDTAGRKLWQRSYYDHVIRNRSDYLDVWQYIDANPAKWAEDELYSPE